jgi:hypothetical protein
LSADARLYLAPERALLRVGGALHTAEVAEAGWPGALAAAKELLRQHKPRERIVVVLSSHYAPLWLLPGAPTHLGHEETAGWVANQAGERYGELAVDARLAFRAAPVGEPILASAIESVRYTELLRLLADSGLTVDALVSWPALALARHGGRASARLALAEPGRLTLVSLQRGAPVALDAARGEQPEKLLADLLARARLTDGLGNAPTLLLGLGGGGSGGGNGGGNEWRNARVLGNSPELALLPGRCEPDFQQVRARPALAGWLLLAAGIGFAALAGQRYVALAEASQPAAHGQVIQVIGHFSTGIQPAYQPPPRPWKDLLDRLESQRPKNIALLSLRADAGRGDVRIEAEARDEAAMLAWLKTLRAQAGFHDATLARHEALEGAGGHPVSFELHLSWGPR